MIFGAVNSLRATRRNAFAHADAGNRQVNGTERHPCWSSD